MRRPATPVERTGPNSARAERDYPLPPEQLLAAVRRSAEALPRWAVESAGETGLRAVRRTRLLRFADDVSVECSAPQDGTGSARATSRATFESASRVGRYDLGQNGRNLRELLGAVEEEIRDAR